MKVETGGVTGHGIMIRFRPSKTVQTQKSMLNSYGNNFQEQSKQLPSLSTIFAPSPEEEEVARCLKDFAAPPTKFPAPKRHRGFGASAKRFNPDGQIPVGEFRENWRCSWCLMSGKYTPTLRKGPMGRKTLCNACGIWYGKHGTLPPSRYHEHEDTAA